MITSWHLFTVLDIHSLHKQYWYNNNNSKKLALFIPGNTETLSDWIMVDKHHLKQYFSSNFPTFMYSYFAFTGGALLTPYNLWIMSILHTVSFNAIINYYNALPVCLIHGCHVNIITGTLHFIVDYSIGYRIVIKSLK